MKRLFALLSLSGAIISPLLAQEAGGSELPGTLLALVGIVIAIFLAILLLVGNSMLQVRSKQLGVADAANYSILPSRKELMGSSIPSYVNGTSVNALKKGFHIALKGYASGTPESVRTSTYAVQPPNFRGLTPIPKLEVEVGGNVQAGDPIFHDKLNPEVKFVSPVSGEVVEVRRGAKRAITHVVILADKEQKFRKIDAPDAAKASREELVEFLASCGFLPLILQRPYNVMPSKTAVPRDIFISTFDTAPLAPDSNLLVQADGEAFQAGLDVLSKLTSGAVHLGLNAGSAMPPSKWFTEATGVEKHWFKGQHPAGCVGVQIHHIRPIKQGETVWTLGVQEVILLGRIFRDKKFDTRRIVALAGAELKTPRYVETYAGAHIGELTKENLANDNVRFVSGDPLSGEAKSSEDFLNWHDDQISVLQEGNDYEAFGWLLPIKPRPSASRTFPNFLMPSMSFRAETNTHGEERAFVVTGIYEEVTPMDLYPQYLMKAILAGNFERMEGLGIYEVVEEDLALCEFICPSKVPFQKILRDGLTMMQEQG